MSEPNPYAPPKARVAQLLSFAMFAVVQSTFLKRSGQTIGKKLMGIRIATLDGGIPSLERTLGLRYLPLSMAALIPVAGPTRVVVA